MVPNLQYNLAGVIRNSLGLFILRTLHHIQHLFLTLSSKDKFIWTILVSLLSAFPVYKKYCMRLNAFVSILLATVIFICYFYYIKEKK